MITVKDLYGYCDNINIYTKTFIINSDHCPMFWNDVFGNVQCELLEKEVIHFKTLNDDEVLIWVP